MISIIALDQIIAYLGLQADPALAGHLADVQRYRDEYGV